MDRAEASTAAAPGIDVEVVYCPAPGCVDACTLQMPRGATVSDALRASGVLERHPGIGGAPAALGVWGRRCEATRVLRAGDRVEVYRPLQVDPMEARRRRHRQQRAARETAQAQAPVSGSRPR